MMKTTKTMTTTVRTMIWTKRMLSTNLTTTTMMLERQNHPSAGMLRMMASYLEAITTIIITTHLVEAQIPGHLHSLGESWSVMCPCTAHIDLPVDRAQQMTESILYSRETMGLAHSEQDVAQILHGLKITGYMAWSVVVSCLEKVL